MSICFNCLFRFSLRNKITVYFRVVFTFLQETGKSKEDGRNSLCVDAFELSVDFIFLLMLCSFLLLFFYATVCFSYLFIKRLCVCIRFFLSAVCEFILFFSFFFLFRLLNSPLIYSQLKEKRFFCWRVRVSLRFSLGLCYSLFRSLFVCMFVVCLSLPPRKNKQQRMFFCLLGKKKR